MLAEYIPEQKAYTYYIRIQFESSIVKNDFGNAKQVQITN